MENLISQALLSHFLYFYFLNLTYLYQSRYSWCYGTVKRYRC